MRRRKLPAAVWMLLTYALMYLSLLVLALDFRTVLFAVIAAVVVLAVGMSIARWSPTTRRTPGTNGRNWISFTSAMEGVAFFAGLAVGWLVGWQFTLPIILTAWAVHLVSIGLTMRRPLDLWLVTIALVNSIALWVCSLGGVDLGTLWPLCGAVAAAVCIAYASALTPRSTSKHPNEPNRMGNSI